ARYALHDRLEHQGTDNTVVGEARGRRANDMENSCHELASNLQTRECRDDPPGPRRAFDLCLHRHAPAGLRNDFSVHWHYSAGFIDDPRHDAAHLEVWRTVPV